MELKNFGFRLKNAIQNSKYTQKQLSEILKISQDTLTNYVKEKTYPSIEILHKICELIDAKMFWIVYGETEEIISDKDKELLNKIKKLSEKNQIKTEGYIEALLSEQQEMLFTSRSTEKRREESFDSA